MSKAARNGGVIPALAAGRYLQSLPAVDGRKIGLWGGSYGGFLTGALRSSSPRISNTGDFQVSTQQSGEESQASLRRPMKRAAESW